MTDVIFYTYAIFLALQKLVQISFEILSDLIKVLIGLAFKN